jgi:retrograde regulation protein 2
LLTRTAINSKEFLDRITAATGWTVKLLTQEEQASIGSDGIAASFASVKGLVLDLGGGSCQLNWMMTGTETVMSKTPVSMPYGAAALTNRLSREDPSKLQEEVVNAFKKAYDIIQVPEELKKTQGHHVWACGGGFRGMGYYLLGKHPVQPYPIPLINGFTVDAGTFTETVATQALATTQTEMQDMFRISKRRATQVPAIALVIHALTRAIPNLTQIHFSQGKRASILLIIGGVREGVLFAKLPKEVRTEDPLLAAVAPYSPASYNILLSMAKASIPPFAPPEIIARILPAIVSLSYLHSRLPKEVASIAALHSMTIGQLAAAPGITHDIRAGIALGLCERWGREIADKEEMARYEDVAGDLAFWCFYCGRVMSVLGVVYPTGVVNEEKVSFSLEAGKEWCVVVKLADKATPVTSVMDSFGKRIKSILGKDRWKGSKYEVRIMYI